MIGAVLQKEKRRNSEECDNALKIVNNWFPKNPRNETSMESILNAILARHSVCHGVSGPRGDTVDVYFYKRVQRRVEIFF